MNNVHTNVCLSTKPRTVHCGCHMIQLPSCPTQLRCGCHVTAAKMAYTAAVWLSFYSCQAVLHISDVAVLAVGVGWWISGCVLREVQPVVFAIRFCRLRHFLLQKEIEWHEHDMT